MDFGDAMYRLRYPHAVLVGVNHASYTTGQMPERVVTYYIESELSTAQSTALLANMTSPFISYVTTVCDISAIQNFKIKY